MAHIPHGNRGLSPVIRLQETHLPNGISARYQYDAGNKLTQLVNRTSQGIISQHVYGYDGVGRRTTHTETLANTTTDYGYAYDNLDRSYARNWCTE